MRHKLLLLSMCTAALLPAATPLLTNYASTAPEQAVDMREGEMVSTSVPATTSSAAPAKAEATDSVTLTIKWTLVSNKPVEVDTYQSFVLMDLDNGTSQEFAQTVLNTYKTTATMPIRVPKGRYAMAFRFKTDLEEAASTTKLYGYDNVTLDKDSTFTFEGKNCTKAIRFRFTTPDGTPVRVPVKKDSKTTEYSAANAFCMYPCAMAVYKHPKAEGGEFGLGGTNFIIQYSYPGVTGSQRENSCDIYVNPDISGNFVAVNYTMIIPINAEKTSYTTTEPTLMTTTESPLNVPDTTFVMDASKYVTFFPPQPRRSQYAEPDSTKVPTAEKVADLRLTCTGFSAGVIGMSRVPGAPIRFNQQPGISHFVLPKVMFLETTRTAGLGTVANGFGISFPNFTFRTMAQYATYAPINSVKVWPIYFAPPAQN